MLMSSSIGLEVGQNGRNRMLARRRGEENGSWAIMEQKEEEEEGWSGHRLFLLLSRRWPRYIL